MLTLILTVFQIVFFYFFPNPGGPLEWWADINLS